LPSLNRNIAEILRLTVSGIR